jgi:hypothetical protein
MALSIRQENPSLLVEAPRGDGGLAHVTLENPRVRKVIELAREHA